MTARIVYNAGDYVPQNWDNRNRRLTSEELAAIRRAISGVHFSQEAQPATTIGMMYAAEALLREVEMRRIQDCETDTSEVGGGKVSDEPWLDNPETD